MEYIDWVTLGIGCLIIFEAARRLNLIRVTSELRGKISNREAEGIPDNCISYKILTSPSEDSKWSPGIGAAIDNRPFAIFLIILLILAGFETLIMYVASYEHVGLFVVAFVFALVLHSGPDKISNAERYLQTIITQDTSKLNGHDYKYLVASINVYVSWPYAQLIFGVAFATAYIWIQALMFYGLLLILLAGFCFLGSKYSIQKGIFYSDYGT